MLPSELLDKTERLTLELSNRCNYSKVHTKCPTSTFTDTKILPLSAIKSVVGELRYAGWGEGKSIFFHVFNEPTIDPRLYWLIQYVRERLPGIKPRLVTNGWYMNEELACELFDIGLDYMEISGYGRKEMKRLEQLGKHPKVKLVKAFLYGWMLNPQGRKGWKPCFAPLDDLTIRASGNVGLCCLDYREQVVFGNVKQESLLSILEREWDRMKGLYDQLTRCERSLQICKLCHRRRKTFKGLK